MEAHHHVIFTTQESYLMVFMGNNREYSTLTLLDSHLGHEDHPLGRSPWLITGIARLDRQEPADITIADPISGQERRLITDPVLDVIPVGSVAEAMVESVLARA